MWKLQVWLAVVWLPCWGAAAAFAQQSKRAVEFLPSAEHRDSAGVTLRLRGIVQPLRHVVLRAPISARVTSLGVTVGESVRAEQVVARLDAGPLEQQLESAEARLAKVRAELHACEAALANLDESARRLREDVQRARQQLAVLNRGSRRVGSSGRVVEGGLGVMRAPLRDTAAEKLEDGIKRRSSGQVRIRSSRSRLLTLRQQLRRAEHAAQAATEMVRQQIAETAVEASVDGVVARRLAQPSSTVQAGDALVELIQTDRLKVVLWLPDQVVRQHFHPVRGKWFARVRAAGATSPWLDAVVRDLAPEPHPQTNQMMLELDVDNTAGRLRAGMVLDAILDNRPPGPPVTSTAVTAANQAKSG